MYLPLNNASGRKNFIKLPIKKMCLFTVSLPLFAFIICVIMTMYKDFEHANNTHCKVANIFPSISASIGNYEPQQTIWSTSIYVHAPIRFLLIYLRWKHYRSVIYKDLGTIVNVAVGLNVVENISLVGLTYWTSTKFYPFHELCFKTFIGTSIFYMLFINILLTKYRRKSHTSPSLGTSLKLKWRMFLINVGSFTFAAYFFLRHNRICEPYVYSMFSFSEYVVVISNIMYHISTVYDLPNICYLFYSHNGISIE